MIRKTACVWMPWCGLDEVSDTAAKNGKQFIMMLTWLSAFCNIVGAGRKPGAFSLSEEKNKRRKAIPQKIYSNKNFFESS